MTIVSRPIPALYTVYVLRSTVRHASLYIGSTPNPPRRLAQHNGLAPGGAQRTSRASLQPWEMVALVSGFPSSVAALKFEWALTNPHLSLHIPTAARISIATKRKKNGHQRRPIPSLKSVLSNLRILLRVPSFARWPLTLRLFAPDVHRAWERQLQGAHAEAAPAGKAIPVLADFATGATGRLEDSEEDGDGDGEAGQDMAPRQGIYALALDYEPVKGYVAKGKAVFDFEQQGDCVVCHANLVRDGGLQALCPNEDCHGVGHLSCWSRRLLPREEADGQILPIQGTCPQCHGDVQWELMMRELTLRIRGQKEVEKLVTQRKRCGKAKDVVLAE